MTYDEIAAQITRAGLSAGEHVYRVLSDDMLDTVCLHLMPVRYFIASKLNGRL